MKCTICHLPFQEHFYRVPVIQAPRFVNGWLTLEESIGSMMMDVIDVCQSCGERQRGVWRDRGTNELVVRLRA
jgi:hypothetical protein